MLTRSKRIVSIHVLQVKAIGRYPRKKIGSESRGAMSAPSVKSLRCERTRRMNSDDFYVKRYLTRRQLIRAGSFGAAAAGVAAAGGGRYPRALAQDATPTAFDAAACYQSSPDSKPTKYDRAGDPPYNIAFSNGYIGN